MHGFGDAQDPQPSRGYTQPSPSAPSGGAAAHKAASAAAAVAAASATLRIDSVAPSVAAAATGGTSPSQPSPSHPPAGRDGAEKEESGGGERGAGAGEAMRVGAGGAAAAVARAVLAELAATYKSSMSPGEKDPARPPSPLPEASPPSPARRRDAKKRSCCRTSWPHAPAMSSPIVRRTYRAVPRSFSESSRPAMRSPNVRRTIVSTPAPRSVAMKRLVLASVALRYSGVASVGLYGIRFTWGEDESCQGGQVGRGSRSRPAISLCACGESSAASASASSAASLTSRSMMYSTIATREVGVCGRAAAMCASSAPAGRRVAPWAPPGKAADLGTISAMISAMISATRARPSGAGAGRRARRA